MLAALINITLLSCGCNYCSDLQGCAWWQVLLAEASGTRQSIERGEIAVTNKLYPGDRAPAVPAPSGTGNEPPAAMLPADSALRRAAAALEPYVLANMK